MRECDDAVNSSELALKKLCHLTIKSSLHKNDVGPPVI